MDKTEGRSILFGDLPPMGQALEAHLGRARSMKIFKNERIDLEEARGPEVLYVQEGRLKLAAHRPLSDSDLNFCFYGPQTVLECRRGPVSAAVESVYVEACENTVVHAFSWEVFYELLREDGALLEQYDQCRAAGQALLCRRMELTACLDADQRVVGWLMALCRQSAPGEDGVYRIPCRLTQQEISDYLLIHVTTFNRVFSELKKNAVVEKKRNCLLVHGYEGLKAFYETLYL